jgi:polyphenol oxidase
MIKQTCGNMQFLLFEHLAKCPELLHGVTTRSGGISPHPFASLNLGINTADSFSNVLANHQALARALNVDERRLVSVRQVHGSRILRVHPGTPTIRPGALPNSGAGCDSLMTAHPGPVLMVRVADCVPLVLFDRSTGALAVIHAGWRGTAAGIAAKTVRAMSQTFGADPGEMLAGIGPSIGPCCYAVGEDVARSFRKKAAHRIAVLQMRGKRTTLDLAEANRQQLLDAGCRDRNIETAGLCTACLSDIFFSHRREQGETGRFALLAGLRP